MSGDFDPLCVFVKAVCPHVCIITLYLIPSCFSSHLLPAVDRCAVSFATSALWYLQRGQIDKALERCDYVIDQVLPPYDKKDIIGLYHIFVQIGRVLKWNGHVGKYKWREGQPANNVITTNLLTFCFDSFTTHF